MKEYSIYKLTVNGVVMNKIKSDRSSNIETLITCGEFAKLCNVSKQTIIYYDKKGVIKPRYIDQVNGYRYYNPESLEVFLAVKGLQYAGMSLKEIKNFFKEQTVDKFKNLIEERQEILDYKINYLLQIKNFMERKLYDIRDASQNINNVYIEYRNEKKILLTKNDGDDREALVKHIKNINVKKNILSYNSVCLLSNIKEAGVEKVDYYYTECDILSDVPHNATIKSGEYLTILHKGSILNSSPTYKKLLSYAEENKIKLCEFIYEQLMIDDFSVSNESEYIYKIFVKIDY